MANPCDNDLSISGSSESLTKLAKWIETQTHPQAPNAYWAALYNLEQACESLDGIGFISSGMADHAYGHADYTQYEDSAMFQWVSKNNPSIDIVILLAKKFPELEFDLTYSEPGHGLSGSVTCSEGEVIDYEGGYESEDVDSEEESEEW